MTVAALLIVGVSLVSASTVEFRSAINQSHSTQAFYVAEAGLNWARRGLVQGTLTLPARLDLNQPHFFHPNPVAGLTNANLAAFGVHEITVTRIADGRWELRSTGLQHQARRTVSWQITELPVVGTGAALDRHHVRGIVSVQGAATVTGNVNASSWGSVSPTGLPEAQRTTLPVDQFTFPRVTMAPPSGLTWRGDFTTNRDGAPVFPGHGQYGTITVNDRLDINVTGPADVVIRVGTLNVDKGSIVITGSGTGRVIFHVGNAFSLDGPINSGGSPARVSLFYHGSNDVKLTGNEFLGGSLITNTANIEISGNAVVAGHILTNADSVRIGKAEDNNKNKKASLVLGRVIYAPNAHLEMQGNDTLTGVIVVEQLTAGGNASLNLNTTFSAPVDTFATNLRRFTFANWNQRR